MKLASSQQPSQADVKEQAGSSGVWLDFPTQEDHMFRDADDGGLEHCEFYNNGLSFNPKYHPTLETCGFDNKAQGVWSEYQTHTPSREVSDSPRRGSSGPSVALQAERELQRQRGPDQWSRLCALCCDANITGVVDRLAPLW